MAFETCERNEFEQTCAKAAILFSPYVLLDWVQSEKLGWYQPEGR